MPIAFTHEPFDRADHRRSEPAVMSDLVNTREAVLAYCGGRMLSAEATGSPVWLDGSALAGLLPLDGVFLGCDDGDKPYYAVQLKLDDAAAEAFAATLGQTIGAALKWRDLRSIAVKLGPDAPVLGAAAHAKSLLDWHARHLYCERCGSSTQPEKAGSVRRCETCEATHFPRTDPVVIMLVLHGEHALLGRSPGWPEGMYSALAGFVEPGESLEAAIAREVQEEAGLHITKSRYIMSQPWPWPSSLMLGCFAWADSPEVTLASNEIEAVRWLDRQDMHRALQGQMPGVILPPNIAVAHNLVQHWLAEN